MRWTGALWVAYFLTWGLIPYILLKNHPPVSTLAWIWAVILFPFVGPLAYLFIGDDRVPRKHLLKKLELQSERRDGKGKEWTPEALELTEALSAQDQNLVKLLSRINEDPASSACSAKVLADAQQFYPALRDRIQQARHHVHIQFYVFQGDQYGQELLDALVTAAGRGVEVRLLCDWTGCEKTKDCFFDSLMKANGKFAWFRTSHPGRDRWFLHICNHRKIQVIDGEYGYVGGMNVGKEYASADPRFGVWKDIQLELSGDVASILQRTFANDWFFATGEKLLDPVYYPIGRKPGQLVAQVMADGPDTRENTIQMSIVAVLHASQRRVWLTTGYFVPSSPLLTALKLCAARGVDVRMLVSEASDHPYLVKVGRSYYEELLRFGVRIFEYSKGVNHAKVMALDTQWMMIGSANFDLRSMRLNFEINALIRDPDETKKLERILLEYYADSREIILDEFKRRPFRERLLESVARPFSPML